MPKPASGGRSAVAGRPGAGPADLPTGKLTPVTRQPVQCHDIVLNYVHHVHVINWRVSSSVKCPVNNGDLVRSQQLAVVLNDRGGHR